MWTFKLLFPLIVLHMSCGVNCFENVRLKRQEYTCTTLNGNPGICTSIKEYKAMLDLFTLLSSNEDTWKLPLTEFENPLPVTEISLSTEKSQISTPVTSKSTQLSRNNLENFNYFPHQCGKSIVSTDRRIAGIAPLNAWPWLVMLAYENKDNTTGWYCGGFLISNMHVITAAHCFHYAKEYGIPEKVRIGEHDTSSTTDGANPVEIKIKKIIIHPEFVFRPILNDIAIVILNEAVTFTAGIRPICLPFPSELRSKNFTGAVGYIAGWGTPKKFGLAPSLVPLETKIPVVNIELLCVRTENSHSIPLNIIYAGSRITSAGRGDSGYPLMIEEDGHIFAIGLTSHPIQCAGNKTYIAYTNVARYLKWITTNTVYNSDLSFEPL